MQNLAHYEDMYPLVEKYVAGRTLDMGAGRLAWRDLLTRHAETYISGDLAMEHPELDLLFDVTKPLPFADKSFDTVFCCSVLEHVRDPWNALKEMWRILAPGGVAIVSLPFIFYLHGQPNDYYRFTQYGAVYLAEEARFVVEEVILSGGLFHFIFNAPSILLSCVLSALRLEAIIPFATSAVRRIARLLDKGFGANQSFAMNIILVLRKQD